MLVGGRRTLLYGLVLEEMLTGLRCAKLADDFPELLSWKLPVLAILKLISDRS